MNGLLANYIETLAQYGGAEKKQVLPCIKAVGDMALTSARSIGGIKKRMRDLGRFPESLVLIVENPPEPEEKDDPDFRVMLAALREEMETVPDRVRNGHIFALSGKEPWWEKLEREERERQERGDPEVKTITVRAKHGKDGGAETFGEALSRSMNKGGAR